MSYNQQEVIYPVDKVNLTMLRKIAMREPLVRKAILKKNKDTVKNWFSIKTASGDAIPIVDEKIISNFDERTAIPSKMYTAGVCANIYGTGFLEKLYEEEINKSVDVSKPVKKNNKLFGLKPINSEFVKERREEKGDLFYIYRNPKDADDLLIHPSRVVDVAIDRLPYSYFGISIIDVLLNVLKSKMTADKTAGDFVDWASRGIVDIKVTGMQDEQEKSAKKTVEQHPYYFIHDEDFDVKIENPQRIDPSPFYEYFYTNIAAAVDMPKHVLIGGDIGNITGSEVGLAAYYSDIENIQKVILTPVIEDIYKELLEGYGRRWKYKIHWNPIFVDEMSEARILQTRTYAATQNVLAGIIDIPESRKILNEGVVDFDVNKIPVLPKNDAVVSDPNIEPQPTVDDPKSSLDNMIKPLTAAQIELIRRNRLLGELELIKQEERLKEAERKRKK